MKVPTVVAMPACGGWGGSSVAAAISTADPGGLELYFCFITTKVISSKTCGSPIYCRPSSITDYLMAIAGNFHYLLIYNKKNKSFLIFIAGVFSR
ncbi:hypothetical protein [Microcoleus sp. B3-D7]|uniref:hypothetical protein n=1 Tax=Microcoleus sp. B3-D7 TaxID=2818659 RepID=UPI002FD6F676